MTRSQRPEAEHRVQSGVVVQYSSEGSSYPNSHERATRVSVARALAALKGAAFAGDYDPAVTYPAPIYFVPGATLVRHTADALGIRTIGDLYGGVVPRPFVATKVLTHPLVSRTAQAPEGWSHEFAPQVSRSVLFGFSAFTAEDARDAGRRVLARGPARVKLPLELGGRGQHVVAGAEELDEVIDTLDPTALTETGVVIEMNCEDVTTFSVGQIYAAGIVASYCGTQRLTVDNEGAEVYGGSELFVVRGGFCALLRSALGASAITAVAKARAYDRAARAAYPDVLASRRNYDVIEGVGPDGRRESGVLEQSWRIGGASSAEVAALEIFNEEPAVRAVRASCTELYGAHRAAPPHATVSFSGCDDHVGHILKYAAVDERVDA